MENIFHDTKDSNCRSDPPEQNGIVFHLTSISMRILIKREDFLYQSGTFDDVLMFVAVFTQSFTPAETTEGRDGSIIVVTHIYVRK